MSSQLLATFDRWVCLVTLFSVFTIACRDGFAQETTPPPIVGVSIIDQKSVITHRGRIEDGPSRIRVNVSDVRSADFQHELKHFERINCEIVPVPTGPLSSASRFYPRVSKLDGTDLELHKDELIKSAIGKRISVTRVVTQEPTAELKPHKPTGPVYEVIDGTLIGFKSGVEDFALQMHKDSGELYSINSKAIFNIVFQEDHEELKKLASLLKRQSGFDKQTIECTAADLNLAVQFSYAQPMVPGHAPDLTVFVAVNKSRNSIETTEAWATISNDTFYDWNNVTVVVQSNTETYTVESVSLPFGQRASFLVKPTLPKLQVKHRWNVVAPSGDPSKTATVTSVLALSNNGTNSMPECIWRVKDFQGKDLVAGTRLGAMLPGKKDELVVADDQTEVVSLKTSQLPIQPKEIQGDQLLCFRGTEKVFTFSNVKDQTEIVVKDGDKNSRTVILTPTANGSIALPEVLVDPNLQNSKLLETKSFGSSVSVLSIGVPNEQLKLDLIAESPNTLTKLTNMGNSLPILDDIITKKKAIEATESALNVLKKERKELASRPSIGETSSYRIPLQREFTRQLQRKDTEIQEQTDALAKAKFDLAEFLRSLPKESPPTPLTPIHALRELGGQITTDQNGNLAGVTFGGTEPARDTDDSTLFDTIGEAISSLSSLALPGCGNINGGRLNELGRSRIAWLDLSGTSVTDETFESLPVLYTLKTLNLSGTYISSKSAAAILRCKRIEHLSVAGTNFTNAGLNKLCSLESLATLDLRGTAISKADIQAFKVKRPFIEVFELAPILELPAPTVELNPRFDAASFWYQRVDHVRELHEKSTTFVKEFLSQKAAGQDDLVGINTTAYACPIYFANEKSPRITVSITNCLNINETDFKTLSDHFKDVPFPDHAIPADGTDAEMAIYEPSTDTLWEFWRLQKTEHGWQACWGGRMSEVIKSNGIYRRPFGTTATCLPMIGGQITVDELAAGEIKHAIGIALVRAKKGEFSWPAQKDDGENCDHTNNCIEADLIQEGQRFRLDPAINVDELDMHPIGKTIAKAAQQYGFVVWDKGGTTGLRAQNPKSYTQLGSEDPYPDLFCPKDQWTVLDGFPWGSLQFLKKDFGKPDEVRVP